MTAQPSPSGQHPLEEPGARGQLHVDSAVIEKIASEIASEVPCVGGPARRVLNLPLGADRSTDKPSVEAEINGHLIALRVKCSINYPSPVETTCRELRALLMRRTEELTGMLVVKVDIALTALTDAADTRPRRRVS